MSASGSSCTTTTRPPSKRFKQADSGRAGEHHSYECTLISLKSRPTSSELADRVVRQHERVLVTRNGRPSFVLSSSDDLGSLEDSLDILEDAEQGKRVRRKDHV